MSQARQMASDLAARPSWKDAAGRTHGQDGYQFGDFSRGLFRRSCEKLQCWSNSAEADQGYRFGDLFLKGIVRAVLCDSEADGGVVPPTIDDESTEHKELAAAMSVLRNQALESLEVHLPRLEARLKKLEDKQQKQELDAQELSELLRIKRERPTYQTVLDELKGCAEVPLNACFIRKADGCGRLPEIQMNLDKSIKVAEKCTTCANDVCLPLA